MRWFWKFEIIHGSAGMHEDTIKKMKMLDRNNNAHSIQQMYAPRVKLSVTEPHGSPLDYTACDHGQKSHLWYISDVFICSLWFRFHTDTTCMLLHSLEMGSLIWTKKNEPRDVIYCRLYHTYWKVRVRRNCNFFIFYFSEKQFILQFITSLSYWSLAAASTSSYATYKCTMEHRHLCPRWPIQNSH